MKVLLVNDYGTPTGGAELIMLSLRQQLRKLGHDARLFASSARPLNKASKADYECLGTTSKFRTLLQSANPWAFHRFSQVLSKFNPDVVHVRIFLTQLSPTILPLLINIPTIYHVAWYRSICPLGTKRLSNGEMCQDSVGVTCYKNKCLPVHDWLPITFQMKLWKDWQHAFNLIVANSHFVKKQLAIQGVNATEVVWNGIPSRQMCPDLSPYPTVVFAGRLVREKGVNILIKAFCDVVRQISEAKLLIAGEGSEKNDLLALTSDLELQDSITFLGHLSREEMEHVFKGAWVQVVPSQWQEPFGLVAAEAMMRGKPVIASNLGGLTEIVHNHKTGFLFKHDDIQELTSLIIKILSNSNLARNMGKAGREFALANFSEECFAQKFLDFYQRIQFD
ncbi:MAG: glycosyltransferase family 4 protein [Xenococcaceae cyanobacterium MO_188.B32]|nr:glycosyltransferase family 4 protein [Xenococcaceae cyanobacterium MO_188.B32]